MLRQRHPSVKLWVSRHTLHDIAPSISYSLYLLLSRTRKLSTDFWEQISKKAFHIFHLLTHLPHHLYNVRSREVTVQFKGDPLLQRLDLHILTIRNIADLCHTQFTAKQLNRQAAKAGKDEVTEKNKLKKVRCLHYPALSPPPRLLLPLNILYSIPFSIPISTYSHAKPDLILLTQSPT